MEDEDRQVDTWIPQMPGSPGWGFGGKIHYVLPPSQVACWPHPVPFLGQSSSSDMTFSPKKMVSKATQPNLLLAEMAIIFEKFIKNIIEGTI